MATPRNRHCANYNNTLSFPTWHCALAPAACCYYNNPSISPTRQAHDSKPAACCCSRRIRM